MKTETIDERVLEEWMYAVNTVLTELNASGQTEPALILQKTLDDMRDRRGTLVLHKHNKTGY
jgi:hypothetical protein